MRMILNLTEGRGGHGRRAGALALLATCLAAGALRAQDADLGLLGAATGHVRPPLLPAALASFGAARAGAWLYVHGGHLGPVHAHAREHLSARFARLSLLDGATWEELPADRPLQGHALVAHGDAVIRVGGMEARNAGGEPEDLWSVACVRRYDPATRRWTDLPPLPAPRSSHDAVVLGDRLVVVGGWELGGPRAVWHDTAWSLDLARALAPGGEAAWEPLPAPGFERRALALAVADGKVVVVGGMTAEGELSRRVDLFDPATGAWSRGPDLPFDGFGAAAVGQGDEVLASGIGSRLHRLSLAGGEPTWEEAGDLAWPRYFHRLVPLGPERLLAVGGVQKGVGHLRACEVLETGATRAITSQGWTVPHPGAAKNRQALAVVGPWLYLFGGNRSLGQHDFGPDDFLSEGWRVHLGDLRAEPRAPLPARRQSQVVVAAPGEPDALLATGGFGHGGQAPRAWPEVWRYDVKADAWTPVERGLPGSRTQHGLAVHGGTAWLLGGLDYDGARPRAEAFSYPTAVLRWDGARFVASGLDLPRARRAFGGALVGDRYVLLGGMAGGDFRLVAETDVLDLTTGTWSAGPPAPRPLISPETAVVGGVLYVAGGSTTGPDGSARSTVANDRLEALDLATGAWRTVLEGLPVPVTHLRLVPWGERLLLVSTHVDGARALRLVVVDPRAAAPAGPRAGSR